MSAPFFVPGGTLARDALSYVTRRADQELYDALCRGEFCYLLTPRQMGKSSLMVRTVGRLRADGATVASMDLTAVGQNLEPVQWYRGLLGRLGRQLGIEDALEDAWEKGEGLGPLQRWVDTIGDVLLTRFDGRIALFIDEIDAVRNLPFSADEFFAAIRECYNRRAQEPAFERLTFCFLGVASPADLIRDVRISPFNIGRRIELTDFTAEEARPLAKGLSGRQALLDRILYWTDGHPYLTQRLCRAAADAGSVFPEEIDALCATLFFGRSAREMDDNLLFVQDRLLRGDVDPAAALDFYARIRAGKPVRRGQAALLEEALLLSGIVRADADRAGRLRPRNRIYERVFDQRWVLENLPDAERRRQRAAYLRGVWRATLGATGIALALGGLALTALVYARRAEGNRLLAEERARQLDAALVRLRTSRNAEASERRRADAEAQKARERQRQAEGARTEADRQKGIAQARTRESQERQRRLQIANGARLLDAGDLYGALLWFAQSAKIATADPDRRLAQEIRFGTLLRRLPRLERQWVGVRAARFSADGTKILLSYADGSAQVRDAATDAPRSPRIGADGRPGWEIRTQFTPDGRYCATFGGFGIRVRDTRTGQSVGPRIPPPAQVTAAALRTDGRRLATGDRNYFQLWDTRTGRPIGPHRENLGNIRAIAFSPDNRRIATGFGYAARVWDAETGAPITPEIPHSGSVNSVRFDPEGSRFVTTENTLAHVWDAATGAERGAALDHPTYVRDACFSPEGRRIATACDDTGVRLWDAQTRQLLLPPLPHTTGATSVTFDPSGARLLSVDAGGVARLWDIAGAETPERFVGEFGNVSSAAFSRDGKILATGDFDYGARLWDAATLRPLGPLVTQRSLLQSIALSPDGKILAAGSDDDNVWLWDAVRGKLLRSLPQGEGELRLAFSPDGKTLATATGTRQVKLWNVASGSLIGTFATGLRGPLDLAFNARGTQLLAVARNREGNQDNLAYILDAASGKMRMRLDHSRNIRHAAFHPDGRRALTVAEDNIVLWEISGRAPVALWTRNELNPVAAALSPDGRRFLTADRSGNAQIWNTETGEPITPSMPHRGVRGAAFSRDGRWVATYGDDRTARVWEVATGDPISPPLRHGNTVREARFFPDGDRLLTLCDDGTGQVWELTRERTSPDRMTHLAELLTARRVTVGGGTSYLTPDALQHTWRALPTADRSAYGPSPRQRLSWDREQAVAALERGAWESCRRHLSRLLDADPGDRQVRALRAAAGANLGDWAQATADHRRIDSHPARALVLEARRPLRRDVALPIGPARYADGIFGGGPSKIFVLLPAPGKRFEASVGVVTHRESGDGVVSFSASIAGKEAFRSPDRRAGDPAVAVTAPLGGATGFLLQIRKSGSDTLGVWAEGRITLEDGRVLRLSDLPRQPLGGL